MVFNKIAAICADFKWSGFWISNALQNVCGILIWALFQGMYMQNPYFKIDKISDKLVSQN